MNAYVVGRRELMGWGMVLVFSLSLGGLPACLRTPPYKPGPDSGVRDRGPLEAQLPPPDIAPVFDVAMPDVAMPDVAMPDTRRYDLPPGCVVPVIQNPCASPCVNAADSDCDGLPNARDPLPTCQPLLEDEGFPKDPLSLGAPTWTANDAKKFSWSCGEETFAAGARLTLAKPYMIKSNTTGPYLVETRFTLGKANDPKSWSVEIQVGLTTGTKYTCTVWMSTTYHVPRPGAYLNFKACGQDSITWDLSPKDKGTGAKGETYILQLYYDTKAHCRVYRVNDATGTTELQSQSVAFPGCAPSRPDTFSVYTSGREATFTHIRAFAYPK